jgi:hypothetical protein
MLKRIVVVVFALAVCCLAAQKTEVVKLTKADTIVTIKMDTIKTVVWDTLVITKTVNDTILVVKTDTVKVSGAKKAAEPVAKKSAKK